MSTVSSVCYHYLARNDRFRRIWGHKFDLFRQHIDYFKDFYTVVRPDDILQQNFEHHRRYMLLTFDDGLREHMKMADYIADLGFRGIFSIPSCILRNEPANPQIIHFGMAYYGVRRFYTLIAQIISSDFSDTATLLIVNADQLSVIELHAKVKYLFKFLLAPKVAREVLMTFYYQYLSRDIPKFMTEVHLKKSEISTLADQGHMLAVHSDTHPLIRDVEAYPHLMEHEIVQAKKELSGVVNMEISVFCYPFGEPQAVLKDAKYLVDAGYKMILTTFQDTKEFNPLDLGRYCTFSEDSTDDLEKNLWEYNII